MIQYFSIILVVLRVQSVELVLRILSRLAVDEKFTKELIRSKCVHDLAALLKRHYPAVAQASINSDVVCC